jgi:epoxyqueuosine reductase QueG
VYGCDICQDVCPWNRGVEKRRADEPLPDDATPMIWLADWLRGDGERLVAELDRLYVPKNDPRWLRRNALVVAGNGDAASRGLATPYLEDADPVLHAAAERALPPPVTQVSNEGRQS